MRPFLPIFLAGLLGAGTASAQSSLTLTPLPQSQQASAAAGAGNAQDSEFHVQRQGEISFVSGGVGEEGHAAMHQAEADYNLRLLFARQGSGEYLAGVGVSLTDGAGKTVLDATSDGPLFYARVPPGHYKLDVAVEGKKQTRRVDVAGSGAVSQSFYWPQGQ